MALREILIIPDPRLKQKAQPVEAITSETHALVKDMFETMYDAPGIGLAATQVGVMQRIVVMDCARRAAEDDESEPDPEPITMINPEIVWRSEDIAVNEEGCLSIPDYYEDIDRPARIRIRFTDLDGKTVEREADGLLAVCMQHEVDHLDGKLFIDYLSRLKRERITKKFAKAARRAAS